MLRQRLLTVAVLLPVLLAAMFLLPAFWWQLALLPPLLIAGREWSRLAGFGGAYEAAFIAALAVSTGLLWMVLVPGTINDAARSVISHTVCVFSAAFWLVIVPCWLWLKLTVRDRFVLAATGIMVLLPTWYALAQLQRDAGSLLVLLGVVWIADTSAYFAGRAFGRHKLAPAVSPGKTWEGVAGAFAGVAVYALVLSLVNFQDRDFYFLVAVFSGMTAFSIVGDLFESWLKRGAGVKDSGAILPGHGGLLDRIDGMLAAMPLAALIFVQPV